MRLGSNKKLTLRFLRKTLRLKIVESEKFIKWKVKCKFKKYCRSLERGNPFIQL